MLSAIACPTSGRKGSAMPKPRASSPTCSPQSAADSCRACSSKTSRTRCSAGLWHELHRHAVDAVAQACRRGTVGEYVAQVAAAAAAMHFRARHAVARVVGALDRAGLRIVEAGPAGAAFEFALGDEQRLIAAG